MDIYFWAKFFNYTVLISLVTTFLSGAGYWYFNSRVNSANLEKIEQPKKQIEKLEKKVKETSKGITSFYEYNGVKREIGGGQFTAIMGNETLVFQKMNKLVAEGNLKELVDIAEKQISDNQEWLTPYLFLGAAYADLGKKESAIKNLEYVLDKAPDDPNYGPKAQEMLKKITSIK